MKTASYRLSELGFIYIRNLLKRGRKEDIVKAEKISEALHNFPSENNEFVNILCLNTLKELVEDYPDLDEFIVLYNQITN